MTAKNTTRGVTISVTIPKQLEVDLKQTATDVGISRSRYIANILMDWQQQKDTASKLLDKEKEGLILRKAKNDCTAKNKDNFCPQFHLFCLASQAEAEKCPEYTSPGEK